MNDLTRFAGSLLSTLVVTTSTAAFAQEACVTNVSGSIAGQTWTDAGSPYCVDDDLFISLLTIEPGVRVLSTGPYTLNVQTTMSAVGTEDEPIVFTALDPDDPGTYWSGFSFEDAPPGTTFDYVRFEYATNSAIRLLNSGAPTVGTRAGTRLVRDINTTTARSRVKCPVTLDGRIVFSAEVGRSGREPRVTDGASHGTFMLAEASHCGFGKHTP